MERVPSLSLKPTHKAVTQYYDDLKKFADLGIAHESAVRSAFQELLDHCARQFDWKLVPEYALKRKGQAPAKIDGALPAPPPPGVAADVRRLHSPSGKTVKKSEPPHVGCYESDAAVFHAFAAAGRKLADLHVHYETAPEFPLQRIENKEVPLNWRVETMKLLKPGPNPLTPAPSPSRGEGASPGARPRAKAAAASLPPAASSPSPPSVERAGVRGHSDANTLTLRYNDFLTLTGIPAEVLDYRLGNRSALGWVIDQYRVTRDEHGKVTSDPNRLDDEQYMVRLIGQVITVSLETQKIVQGLPPLRFEDATGAK